MRKGFKYLILAVLAIGLVGGAGYYFLSGGFSARTPPGPIEAYVARRLRLAAIPRQASALKNPASLDKDVLATAKAHFADHCASCHANDGSGDTMIGRGLYPRPPDMRQSETQGLTDGALYYIITNGIRFTGMPAFGEKAGNQQDMDSWGLVHFIRHLPRITPEELADMESMNPRSPAEIQREDELERFLRGEDINPIHGTHQH
jgi:mono/diheme cytochrome c family protein